MRETLTELVRQTSPLFGKIMIKGTVEETTFLGRDDDKTMFFQGSFKTPFSELSGEYGIGNLGLLGVLLNFPSYKTENAQFNVVRGSKPNVGEVVTEFRFISEDGGKASYKTMAGSLFGEQAMISNIPWSVKVTPTKARLAEFTQLSGVYSSFDSNTSIKTEDGKLIFSIGGTNESSHNVSTIFAIDVEGEITKPLVFNTAQILSVMKLMGTNAATVNITTHGIFGATITTGRGIYNYYVRGKK